MGSQSNLADAMRLLDRCTDDELRQIQACLEVRLGTVTTKGRRQTTASKKVAGQSSFSRGGNGRPKAAAGKTRPRKGNPQRRSQYETHPLYKAYKAARRAAEAQAKADNVRFSDLQGDVALAYEQAFTAWYKAKRSFRGSGTESQASAQPEGSVSNKRTDPIRNSAGRRQEFPADESVGPAQDSVQGDEGDGNTTGQPGPVDDLDSEIEEEPSGFVYDSGLKSAGRDQRSLVVAEKSQVKLAVFDHDNRRRSSSSSGKSRKKKRSRTKE